MDWDLTSIRKIAGINESVTQIKQPLLNEGWEEDDEDPDVAKAEKELKKKNIKLPVVKADVEKDLENITKKDKKVEDKKVEDKKVEDKPSANNTAEKSKRGKAPQEGSKSGQLRKWISENPGKTRKDAWVFASKELSMTPASFSTIYQIIKSRSKQVKESFIIMHPVVPKFVLHENEMMGMYQWVSIDSNEQDPVIFETEEAAKKTAKYLKEFKNQASVIEKVDF